MFRIIINVEHTFDIISSHIGNIPAVCFSLANFISVRIASTTSRLSCLIA